MTISKRNTVRTITFGIAIAGVLVTRNIQLMNQAKTSETALKYSYMRAVEDLSTATDNINNTLEKQLYAGSGDMHRVLAEKLWRDASTAKAALCQLPIEELQLENTYKFLSQVGNFALSISEKISEGEEITDEEYQKLKTLSEYSQTLSDNMWALDEQINSGEISLVSVANENADSPTVTEGFTDFEEGFDSYPTLIYDGPFSDHILEKEPIMLNGLEEVTQKKALEKAILALNVSVSDLPNVDEEAGKMPSWRFSDDNSTISCAVTKQGGLLSYFLKSRSVSTSEITNEQGIRYAEKFLEQLGIRYMKTTYYEAYGGVLTVNFAYNDNGKTVYTDLVKVSVAMDNGEILGYDARGYIVNHTDREYPDNLISEITAQEKVSTQLVVQSKQLCVIPSEGTDELLCYEFKCRADNGKNVLVYINAETGKEEQILILFESESGTLTM